MYSRVPLFEQAYALHIPTAGNLTGHALAIALMGLGVPSEACEKLVVTFCIIGLALAFRYAVAGAKSAHPAAALLVMPFLYNWPLQMGFWSFSLGVPFVLICLGIYLRHRSRWNARTLTFLFLATGSAYLCHPISWAVCGFVVAVMALWSEWPAVTQGPDRRRAAIQAILPLCVFVPFVIPNFLFARQNELVRWPKFVSIRELLWPLYTDAPLHLFGEDSAPAKALFLFFSVVSLATLFWKLRTRKLEYTDLVLPIFVMLLIIGIVSPGRIGEGTFLGVRLLFLGYLVWALWLALALIPGAEIITASGAVVISVWLLIARIPAWRAANHALSEIVRVGRVVAPNSVVCQLDSNPDTNLVPPMDMPLTFCRLGALSM